MAQIAKSIEQSLKLLKLRLDVESSDMYYLRIVGDTYNQDTDMVLPMNDNNSKIQLGSITEVYYPDDDMIPAWSLGALLELMPKEIIDESGIDYKLLLDVKEGFPKYYSASYEIYHGDFPYPIRDEDKTLFEYIVEAVIWLLENNYIKPKKTVHG